MRSKQRQKFKTTKNRILSSIFSWALHTHNYTVASPRSYWRSYVVCRPKAKVPFGFIGLEDLNNISNTSLIIFLEMASAMRAWVHVLESFKPTFHDGLFLICWLLRVVCSKCVHQWPWIHPKFLSIEGTGLVCLNVIEIVSESA